MARESDHATTLADDVHERLRTLVVEHVLGAGERLTIDALARRLDVSATPVREALARLAAERLAYYEPNVGYKVTQPLDAEEYSALMEARLMVEPRLAGLAARRRSTADLRRVPRDVTSSVDRRAEIAADAAFHAWVARCARNQFLDSALSGLHAHLHIYRLHHPQDESGITAAEHHAIRDAVEAGDEDRAIHAMHAHLEGSYRRHAAGLPPDAGDIQ